MPQLHSESIDLLPQGLSEHGVQQQSHCPTGSERPPERLPARGLRSTQMSSLVLPCWQRVGEPWGLGSAVLEPNKHTHTHTHTCTNTHARIHTHSTHINASTHIQPQARTQTQPHTHVRTCTHTHTHSRTHIFTHANIHTHKYSINIGCECYQMWNSYELVHQICNKKKIHQI